MGQSGLNERQVGLFQGSHVGAWGTRLEACTSGGLPCASASVLPSGSLFVGLSASTNILIILLMTVTKHANEWDELDGLVFYTHLAFVLAHRHRQSHALKEGLLF